MSKQEEQWIIEPKGLVQFLGLFLEELLIKKNVANFDTYESAKQEVISDIVFNKRVNADYDHVVEYVGVIEQFVAIEEYFNNI